MLVRIINASSHKTKVSSSTTGKITNKTKKKKFTDMGIDWLVHLNNKWGNQNVKNVYQIVREMTGTQKNNALCESCNGIFQGNKILTLKYY